MATANDQLAAMSGTRKNKPAPPSKGNGEQSNRPTNPTFFNGATVRRTLDAACSNFLSKPDDARRGQKVLARLVREPSSKRLRELVENKGERLKH